MERRRVHHLGECGQPSVEEWAATSLLSPKSDKCEAKGEEEVPPLKRLASLFKRAPPLLKRGALLLEISLKSNKL
jgi:hypothetical protein